MQIRELSELLSELIGHDNFKITPEGKISQGDFSFTLNEYLAYFSNSRLEVWRKIEMLNPPLSPALKQEISTRIEFIRTELRVRKWKVVVHIDIIADNVLELKIKLASDLIQYLEKEDSLVVSSNPMQLQGKIPLKVSLRELAIMLYGFSEAKLFGSDTGKINELFASHFMYLNERDGEFKEINILSLRKECSEVKKAFGGAFVRNNPISSAEEKISLVLEKIKSIHSLPPEIQK